LLGIEGDFFSVDGDVVDVKIAIERRCSAIGVIEEADADGLKVGCMRAEAERLPLALLWTPSPPSVPICCP